MIFWSISSSPKRSTSSRFERGLRHRLRDAAVGAHLRVIADAAQQAVGDARRPPAAARDLLGRAVLDRDTSSSCAERCTIVFNSSTRVRIQPQHQPEAAAQRRADQALPRGRADRGELRHRQRMRARARARAHQDIDAEILQRRVEHLLHVRQQAVNLVDEEDLVQPDVAEDAGEVELLLQDRAGGRGERDFRVPRR